MAFNARFKSFTHFDFSQIALFDLWGWVVLNNYYKGILLGDGVREGSEVWIEKIRRMRAKTGEEKAVEKPRGRVQAAARAQFKGAIQ